MAESNQNKKIECIGSVISSVRALPSIAGDAIHHEYYNSRGRIVNHVWNESKQVYEVPTVAGCPGKTYSLNIPSATPNVCNTLGPNYNCPIGVETKVRLPSLVFLAQNNVECSLNPVSVEDAFCSLTNSKQATACLPKECSNQSACHPTPTPGTPENVSCESSYSCRGGLAPVSFPFSPNGILASVYNIFKYKNFGFFRQSDKDIVEFMICPYENSAITDLSLDKDICNKLEKEDCLEQYPKVIGTYPFCIGGKYKCACVNLLLHGAMTRDGDESDACLISDLHWVSVKVYLKNKNGIICTRKPATVHIEANQNDPLSDCFVACFATTRPIVTGYTNDNSWPYPSDPSTCPNPMYYPDCKPPVPPYNVPTTPCNGPGQPKCKLLEIIWVSDCVDIEEFDSFNHCNIFVVLLPCVQKCSLLD